MIFDFLINYYDYRPFKSESLNKVSGKISKSFGNFANAIFPIYYRIIHKKNIGNKVDGVIVSLTTFPQRIDYLWLVIESIFRQTVLPEKIILYLSKSQFRGLRIPASLTKYQGDLFEIHWVDEDYRSHKKYWYAVSEYASKDIITIDDDIMYPSTFIETLLICRNEHDNCVISNFWHPIKWGNDGNVLPYSAWVDNRSRFGNFETTSAFFGSGGGTLFPVGSLKDANSDFDIIKECCPTADDIWLNAIVRKNGYKIFCLPYKYSMPEWRIKKNTTLSSVNNGKNMNDLQLDNVQRTFMQLFNINPFKIIG